MTGGHGGSAWPSRRALLAASARLAAALWLHPSLALAWPQHQGPSQPALRPPLEPPPPLRSLQEQWRSAVRRQPFATAISVIDLQSGEAADLHGDEAREPGCTVNLFVLISVVQDLEAGRYAEPAVGADIASTIRHSSASRGRALLVRTGDGDVWRGIDKVNALIRALGLRSTLYDHPPGYWQTASRYGRPNTTTANEMTQALGQLWHGELLDGHWTRYLLDQLTQVKPGLNYLIPAGVPAHSGGRVAHKNGFLWHPLHRWVDNDIGIVWRETTGGAYAYCLALFFQDVAGKYHNVPLGQQLARLTWQAFAQRYAPAAGGQ